MRIFHTINEFQSALNSHRQQTIALVPTMGNLHDGHVSLVNIAKNHADIVVVSIFVNPTQFGVGEDFDSYPRTLDQDLQKLIQVNCDYIFAPNIDEIYPVYPPSIQVLSGDITKILCGKTRPTHFDGVGLVVSKLFNIVKPDVAVFGKKDYQQLAIIKQLNQELNFGIQIVDGEIVRADDGLALSSRNGYLTDEQRKIAPILNQSLNALSQEIINGFSLDNLPGLTNKYKEKINQSGFVVDYLEILTDKLKTPNDNDKKLVILVAAYLGKTRLLDNQEVVISE
ncbi:MAG: pantoate--beta-alanine ligase [Moraxella sp.]